MPATDTTTPESHHEPSGDDAPTDRRMLVLANPSAGSADDALLGTVCRVLGAGAALDVAVTSSEDDVDDVLRERLDGHRLVVVGGDGSLHVAVNALWRLGLAGDVEVGYVPAGTSNALGRATGVPDGAEAAAEHALGGRARPADLLEAEDGRVVVNDVHTGVGAPPPAWISGAKRVIGRKAYPLANGIAGLTLPGWPVRVTVDDEVIVDGDVVLTVGLGNGRFVGDDDVLWPDAVIDDGLVDVMVTLASGVTDRIALARAMRRGEHVRRDDVVTARGRVVRIEGGSGEHNADGVPWPDVDDMTYTVRHTAWRPVR